MLNYISQINTFYQFISCFWVSLNFGISPFSRLLWRLTNLFWKLFWSIFVQTLRFLLYFHTLNMKINLFPVLIPTRTNCVRPRWSSTKQPTTSPTCRTPCHSLNQTPGAGLSPGTTKTFNVPWVPGNPPLPPLHRIPSLYTDCVKTVDMFCYGQFLCSDSWCCTGFRGPLITGSW